MAQNINRFEYFFDSDPGIGSATKVTANANTGEVTQSLSLSTAGLNEGFHFMIIRAEDDLGNWGLHQKLNFYVFDAFINTPIANIEEAQYWFDEGTPTNIPIVGAPSETTESFSIPLGTLPEGFHTLTIRVKNTDGVWSLYDKRPFYIIDSSTTSGPISNIEEVEYWFDSEPAPGGGTQLPIAGTPSQTTESFVIPLGGLTEGFHTFGFRAKNTDGVWGLYDRRVFYVMEDPSSLPPIPDLEEVEYWFDTDLGPGNNTPLAVSGTSTTTDSYVIPLGSLDAGFHKLGIRAKNVDGVWGLYDKRVFYIFEADENAPPAALTEMEFLYDEELGFGTGQTVPITPTGNPDEYLVEIPTDLVTCDIHDLWVSVKNEDGGYSLYNILVDVDVFDNADPTIVTFENIEAALDATGNASITIDDVDNGTFDDCELVSVVLNQSQFDYTCADLGDNTVTITATDGEGKVSTENVTITVVDNINPVAVTKDITVQLDASGNATIVANQIENGSTDNCTITGYSLDTTSFDCSDLGSNTVSLTVTDSSGNTDSADAIVTVEDIINPVASAKNITVQLDASSNASITPDDVDDGSSDNCAIVLKSLDIFSFTCADLGANSVMLTVEDSSGNTDSVSATVTVEDNINPTVVTKDITVQLDASGNASIVPSDVENGSSDNCTIAGSSLDIEDFDCNDLGANTVMLSVTDQSGNTGTGSATITVEDIIDPVAVAKNITVQLDGSGNASITPDDVDNGSSDNCAIVLKSLDIFSFTCTDLGSNTVMFTVEDSSGNSDTVSATVTVEDNINPTVVTKDITVQLDATGNASIVPSDVENGSSDNCTIAGSSLDIEDFDCNELGTNTVMLSVTDQSGNTGTGSATITVEDIIDPVAVAKNITVQLDGSGNASITPDDVDDGSSDNCAIVLKSLDIFSFTCADLGANTVMLTVEDSSGNTNMVSTNVNVEDNIAPTIIGKDITRNLPPSSIVTITTSDVDNGSSDNCPGLILSIDVDTFTAEGVYPVVLTATDSEGNTNSTTVMVTITDTLSAEDEEVVENYIDVYPIPVVDYLTISTSLILEKMTIYDINGKMIKQINKPESKINLSLLSGGVYFLRFDTNNSNVHKRIVKY